MAGAWVRVSTNQRVPRFVSPRTIILNYNFIKNPFCKDMNYEIAGRETARDARAAWKEIFINFLT